MADNIIRPKAANLMAPRCTTISLDDVTVFVQSLLPSQRSCDQIDFLVIFLTVQIPGAAKAFSLGVGMTGAPWHDCVMGEAAQLGLYCALFDLPCSVLKKQLLAQLSVAKRGLWLLCVPKGLEIMEKKIHVAVSLTQKDHKKKHFVILLLCACVKDNHINIYSHLTAYITIIS